MLTHIVRDVERSARLQEQHERRLERDAATCAKEVRRTVSVLVGGVVAACEVCCPVCSVVVGNDCFSIRCDQCQRWVHGCCAAIDAGRCVRCAFLKRSSTVIRRTTSATIICSCREQSTI